MSKKKTRRVSKIKKSKWRKFLPWTLLASALLIGAFVIPSNLLNQNQKKAPPKIDSISPSPVIIGKEFTVTGSGFTKEEEYQGPKRSGGVLADYPGNWYQIKGTIGGPPAFSPDGKTVKFSSLDIDVKDIPKDCQIGTGGKKCQVEFQLINGYGVPSSAKQIEILIPEVKPLIFSSGYAIDNPATLNIPAGATDVDVLRVKVRADAQNSSDLIVTDLMIQTGPPTQSIDCYNTFSSVNAYEVESGRLIGLGVLGPSPFNQGCWDFFPIYVVLPPGTEKTILLKMSLKSTAQVGLQFNLGATPYPGGYTQWVDYPDPQGLGPTITVVAP